MPIRVSQIDCHHATSNGLAESKRLQTRQRGFKHAVCVGLCAFALLLMSSLSGIAAEVPRVELSQLVSQDAGLVVELRGLTEQAKKLPQSALVQRVKQHSAWQQILNSPEIRKLKEVDQVVRGTTEHSLLEWIDIVLGREAILAISPPGGRGNISDRPQFLLLTRLKQREDLSSILGAWSKFERSTETRFEHRGQTYFSRAKENTSDHAIYYAQIADVLLVCDHTSTMTTALDLAKDGVTSENLSNVPPFKRAIQLLNPAATIRVFIQPRVWKEESQAGENAPRDVVERVIQQAWRRCDAVAVGIRLESGIIAEAIVLSEDLGKSPQWKSFVDKTSGSPSFLTRVPRTALAAFAGRHDVSALSEWGLSQLPPEQLKQVKAVRQMVRGFLLGNDLLDDVLPQLPVDFGGFVVPRSELDVKAVPVDGLIAVSLPAKNLPNARANKPPFRDALSNGIQTGFSMLTALYNASTDTDASLEDEELKGVSLHWINRIGPYQPAYALSDEYLLVASSPKLIRDFLTQSGTETWAADPDLRKFRDACFADASQVLALHGRVIREFVGQNRDFFVKQLVSAHNLTPADANKRLDRMLEWVQLSDAVVLATTFSSDHVKVVLGIAVEGTPEKR